MPTIVWIAVSLAGTAGLLIGVYIFRRSQRFGAQARRELAAAKLEEKEAIAQQDETTRLKRELGLPQGRSTLLDPGSIRGLTAGELVFLSNPLDENEFLVFGDGREHLDIGEPVGPVPRQLAAAILGAEAILKGGLNVGEQAGVLVRLTDESARALREGARAVDSSGQFLSVVRNNQGQFRHLMRFKEVSRLQGLSSGVGILSAVAMQAQLAAIEKELANVLEGVKDIQATLDRQEYSELIGTQRMLRDIFKAAYAEGIFTQAAWDQIAPHYRTIESQAESAHARLRDLLSQLESASKVSARRDWMDKHGHKIREAHHWTQLADESLYQYEALRCWWLVLSEDPTAEHYSRQVKMRKESLEKRRDLELAEIRDLLERAGEVRWWNYVHAPRASHQIKDLAARVRIGIAEIADAAPKPETQIEVVDPGAGQEPEDR